MHKDTLEQLTPNYRNLAILHNWLLAHRKTVKDRYEVGQWIGRLDQEGLPVVASAVGWGALSGLPELARDTTHDNNGMVYDGEPVVSWPKYMKRVYGLNMGMSEYSWIESVRWRTVDGTLDGAIARIRFVIDNALDLPGLGEIVDVLAGKKPIPYDVLETEPYDLNKTF